MILGILIITLVLIIPGLLLLFLHRQIQRHQDPTGARWMLLTVMAWGFLWVISRLSTRYWGDMMSPSFRLALLLVSALLCLLVYGLIYLHIGRQGKLRKLENQMKEIGHPPEEDV